MRGICVTSKALRDILERVMAGQDRIADKDVVARRLLIAMSRDLEALTAKVDALCRNLPENQPTNMQDILHVATCDHCGRPSGIDYCPMCGWGTDNDD